MKTLYNSTTPSVMVWHSGIFDTEGHVTIAATDYGEALKYMKANFENDKYSFDKCHCVSLHLRQSFEDFARNIKKYVRSYSFKIHLKLHI